MPRAIVESQDGVTLVGGAPVGAGALALALAHAPRLVAADGGADRLLRLGQTPEAVIGDLDSISAAAQVRLADRLHRIDEQDSTDFDKALRHISAPVVIGLGFWGARMDHGLAVLNALARHPDRRCVLLGGRDLAFLAPRRLELALRPGDRLSLFPLGPVTGRSSGLRWPIQGLEFAPDGIIGTSNMVSAARVSLEFDAARMLVILPRGRLAPVLAALWPQSARGG